MILPPTEKHILT